MVIKTSFEPKDARITFEDEYDSDDNTVEGFKLLYDEKPGRKKKTGTQALVEFLNTTSPKEFQTTMQQQQQQHKKSALFFRRRKGNQKEVAAVSTIRTLSPHTIQRKNYIEIVSTPYTESSKNDLSSSSSSSSNNSATDTISGSTTAVQPKLDNTSKVSSVKSSRVGNPHNQSSVSLLQLSQQPILPFRNSILRNNSISSVSSSVGITTTHSHRPSVSSSLLKPMHPKTSEELITGAFYNPETDEDNESGQDFIERGLKQRLAHFQSEHSSMKPSDIISDSLAIEHTTALGLVSSMVLQEQNELTMSEKSKKKGRPRHVQVQTAAFIPDPPTLVTQAEPKETNEIASTNSSSTNQDDNEVLRLKLEVLEKELLQEKQENAKLSAALEDTYDHFETLNGLAYKKLREIWEEKVRWENACIEAKERCWQDHQQQIVGSQYSLNSQYVNSKFIVEGEEDLLV